MSLCVILLLTWASFAKGGTYLRIEASFAITNLATDPFDYLQSDVRVQILQPDSSTLSLPAFFDGGTTWRVRHTPPAPGNYQVAGVTLNGAPLVVGNLQPAGWTVTAAREEPSFIRVDPSNPTRFITSRGQRYYPIGHNVAWDVNTSLNVSNIMAKLGAAHENWSRIWMDHWDGKNLDWPKVGSNFGTLNLTAARKWDGIISAAEQSGVSFQLTFQHHGQYSTTVDPNWNDNPYNSVNGGFLTSPTQFFTNATAKALTKRKLRYAIARWGYSPAIMAWELFNEVQFTDSGQANQWSVIGAWHDEMVQFLRSQDVYQHLITTSSAVDRPIWDQCDFYTHHDYTSDYISALRDPIGVPVGEPVKPIFAAEAGSDLMPFHGLHAPLWAGVMGAQSGAAQPWYWDRIDAEGGYRLMRSVSDFVTFSGIAEQDGLIKSAPRVTCPQSSSLAFSPGGNWANATQDTFTVGDVAPDGIGTLPSFLQGNFHRSMTPNGFTFLVNYPETGTFSVQILTIAASGAGLTVTVDNTTTNTISFPATGSDQSTNLIRTVNVPAGQHTIRLWNSGMDWVNLGNITLDPYVPMLAAYQIGNTNFAALWLWHRTNIYHPNASSALSGSFPIQGLQPGTYLGTWWDTFAGTALSNFTFTIVGTNATTISTPPILRSVAFYAGKPPQALVETPFVTKTLGTNSPSANSLLKITNSGGLPLVYSLSITGTSPAVYTAINSTQSGGPLFAWKDYSAVGREITTNFIALTGKTAKDEGIAGPIDIGFDFPFFGAGQTPNLFNQLYVSPNGFVTFSSFAGDTSVNRAIPGALAPTNLIAFFWDDLDLSTTGRVFVDNDPINGDFTLQFQDVRFKGFATTVTCQLVLKTTGEILMQYKSAAISNSCTLGVQNVAGNQGLQVAFNQSYVQNNLCIRLTPNRWLDPSGNAGVVHKSNTELLNLSLNPSGLGYGTYSANILIKTSDPTQSLVSMPVVLNITPIGTWRQTHFGISENQGTAVDTADPDHDGLSNILEYAFNTNPNITNPSPITYAIVGDHLTITFKRSRPAPQDITYLFEVAGQLNSGVWQSGAAFTSQIITDNHDGTETVTVVDNAVLSSTPAHYLRIRISSP